MPQDSSMSYSPTGNSEPSSRVARCSFGKYTVEVEIGPDDEFRGVVGVSVRKDFRSQKQKIESRGYHDVTDLYEAESE